ncbi:BQ5605_C033g11140 [Microbotryum silenes-dioicae]|uniref:BQ5605_C033g11140 protein n=1 Tax=Microbotryum silenes-dioicae TaxID=796604 RepID=A0A2X0MGT5_9BASI|nr:BQ5605_C033g11140 [Microbotryum silenes-dioicae]
MGVMAALLAHEFVPLGVKVNAIAPSLFASGMTRPGMVDDWGRSTIEASTANEDFGFTTPLGGSGAKDVESTALMLLVNLFITGETVLVNGGCLLVRDLIEVYLEVSHRAHNRTIIISVQLERSYCGFFLCSLQINCNGHTSCVTHILVQDPQESGWQPGNRQSSQEDLLT